MGIRREGTTRLGHALHSARNLPRVDSLRESSSRLCLGPRGSARARDHASRKHKSSLAGRRVERRPRVRRESRRALAAGDVRRGGGSDAGEGETAVAGAAGAEEGVGGQRQATRPRRWRRRCRRRGGGDCRHGLALLDEFP
uniref:Uncharacterized protein n=1 Tax=Oryza barthii TaxID=65489 RepID=A0A0D3HHK1_9ORYZ